MSGVQIPPEAVNFSLRKVTVLGVLCCFVVCMALLAYFFLSSVSLINITLYNYIYSNIANLHLSA